MARNYKLAAWLSWPRTTYLVTYCCGARCICCSDKALYFLWQMNLLLRCEIPAMAQVTDLHCISSTMPDLLVLSSVMMYSMTLFILNQIPGREGWTSWWEAEAETRERSFRAPDETYDGNSSLYASSHHDGLPIHSGTNGTLPSPRASSRTETDDALCWLPRISDVAVDDTLWSRHLEG